MPEPDSKLSRLLNDQLSMQDILPAHAAARLRPLKIVHLCWMDAAGAGGAACRLHNGLRAIGADSTMIVLHKLSADPSLLIPPMQYSGNILECSARSSEGTKAIIKNDRRWALLVSQYPGRPKTAELFTDPFADLRPRFVREIVDADIVNFHWVAGMVDFPTLPAELSGKPIVWTMHDMNPFTGGCHYSDGCEKYCESCGKCPNLGSQRDEDASRYFHKIKAQAFSGLDIHPVSPSRWLAGCSEKSSILKKFKHRVIPNGIPTSLFRPHGRNQLRERYSIAPGARFVLFGAASITIERKGFRYLREALSMMAADSACGNIALGVFGSTPDNSGFDGLPFPVTSFGHVSDQALLAEIYSAADVYVLPTLADNLPNTLIEAMACGCPAVAFETGGIPDIIEHKKTGWIAAQRDVQGLVDGIKWVLYGDVPREKLASICRKTAVERYDEIVQARAYLQLYRECAQPLIQALDLTIKGDEACTTGDTQKARDYFDKALSAYPKLSRPSHSLGMTFLKENDTERAIAAFTRALDANPSNRDSAIRLCECLIAAGNPQKAANTARLFLDGNPVDSEVQNVLARSQAAILDTSLSSAVIDTTGYIKRPVKISAVVAAALDSEFVIETVQDLLGQEPGTNMEILVVSTATGPEDYSFLENMMRKAGNIRCIVPPEPQGIYQAINLGVRMSSGQFCIAVICGDRLAPDCISGLAGALSSDEHAAASYGDSRLTDMPHQNPENHAPSLFHDGFIAWKPFSFDMLIEEYGLGPHVMWRRSLNDTIGYFDFLFDSGADQDLWMRFARNYRLVHIESVTGLLWLNELSKNRFTRTLRQFPHIRQKYKLFPQKPFSPDACGNLSPQLAAANKALDEIILLVENGKNREALELYEQTKQLFEFYPEHVRIKTLVGQLRKKV
jgi:glycosyltransferase involved in cell wall biosynthesis